MTSERHRRYEESHPERKVRLERSRNDLRSAEGVGR